MPFEPLQTDEPQTANRKPPTDDMDAQMIAGCSAFVASALITYVLGVWPFFVLSNTHLLARLILACAIAFTPSAILGAFATRRAGLAGACGFLGGSMAVGIFLLLRLKQLQLGRSSRDFPVPEYPESWVWMIPVGWVLVAIATALFLLPKHTFSDDGEPTRRR